MQGLGSSTGQALNKLNCKSSKQWGGKQEAEFKANLDSMKNSSWGEKDVSNRKMYVPDFPQLFCDHTRLQSKAKCVTEVTKFKSPRSVRILQGVG